MVGEGCVDAHARAPRLDLASRGVPADQVHLSLPEEPRPSLPLCRRHEAGADDVRTGGERRAHGVDGSAVEEHVVVDEQHRVLRPGGQHGVARGRQPPGHAVPDDVTARGANLLSNGGVVW